MFSNTNANYTQNSKGGGRPSQSRASSRGGSGKSGKVGDRQDGDKGAPKKTPQRSKEAKQKHRADHARNSATRFYGDRTPPNKSNVGDGTHLVTDLIQNAMQLFGILLELTTHEENIPEACQLDTANFDDIFEYVSLALDNAMLRSNTDKSKNSARNSVEIPPGTSNEAAKKLRNAAAKKATASVPTGDNHSATMIRIIAGRSLPGEVYAPLKAAWNKVRERYPLLQECKLVLEFLRRDEYLFASALIPITNSIAPKNAFANDCRKIPQQRQFASAMLAALETPSQNQNAYQASSHQPRHHRPQHFDGSYGGSYDDMGMGGGRSSGNPNSGFHISPWNRGGGAEQQPNLQGHSGKGGKAYSSAYVQDQQEAQDFRAYKAAKAANAAKAATANAAAAEDRHWDDESHTQTNQQPNQQQPQPDWQQDTYPLSKGDVFGTGHN